MFPQTLHRVQYLVRWLCFVFGFSFLVGLVAALVIPATVHAGFDPILVIFLPLVVAGMVLKIGALDLPRVRSIGWSPWLLLLLLVPLANVILQILLFVLPPKKS